MPGKPLNSQAQQLVMNVYEYFELEKENGGPLEPFSSVQERVAAALKISRRTVCTIKKRKENNPILSSPGKNRPRTKSKTSDLPEGSQMAVRNTLYDMYQQKKHVTLRSLSNELRNKEIVSIGKTSLSILLKELGFKYKTDDNRRALIERTSIAALRAKFLRKYMENLESAHPREVVYLDETWIYSKGNKTNSWQDESIKSVRKPEGYDGKRFIVVHAGSSEGFVSEAGLLFCSKSKVADYHGEMNNEIFSKWITRQLIPNLEEPSLIVMDNAPYHSVLLEKQPSTASKKDEIVTWLTTNNIRFDSKITKPELLQIVKMNGKEKVYVIDELLREHGHEVLRLPPYHCEFNAIELIWGNCKSYYNKYIGRDGHSDIAVINMWQEALNQCNTNIWKKCERHTHEIIKKWYDRDKNMVDIDIPTIRIDIGDSSDSESDSEI